MSGHTPGPWHVSNCESHRDLPLRTGNCGAVRSADGVVVPASSENLRLKAAAPEMLDALQAARPFIDPRTETRDGWSVLTLIDAAIAKATGGAR